MLARASQCKSDADCDPEPDVTEIPAFVQNWTSTPQVVSAVRRPAKLPDPQSYHEAIETQAIFELDEKQEDGSTETVLVVPFPCSGCRHRRKACSRARPACLLCRKSREDNSPCRALREGYQRLPPPKVKKPSLATNSKTLPSSQSRSRKASLTTAPLSIVSRQKQTQSPGLESPEGLDSLPSSHSHKDKSTARGSRSGKTASTIAPLSITSGRKRAWSSGLEPNPPRKVAPAESTSGCRKRARRHTASTCQDMDVDTKEFLLAPSIAVVEPVGEQSALKWTFVKNRREREQASSGGQGAQERIYSNPRVPRIWTNSLNGFLTVFPELAKAPIGFSYFQSDIPVLLLDTNYHQGRWINPTTLTFDLPWDFSCHDSGLEAGCVAELGIEVSDTHTHPYSSEHVAPLPENTLYCDVHMAEESFSGDQRCSPPLLPTQMAMSTPPPMFSMLPLDGVPQEQRGVLHGVYEPNVDLLHGSPQDVPISPVIVALGDPPSPLTPLKDSPPPNSHLVLDELPLDHMTSSRSHIPVNKPPEVETLLDCQGNLIPLLVWLPHHSELILSLSPEYAYLSLGLFCVSEIHHSVIQYNVSSDGITKGRVSWSVTLQWVPGGEEGLFDCGPAISSDMVDSTPFVIARDLLHPWWVDPTEVPQADQTNDPPPNYFTTSSFIPLDFLADFHPSESFPRGWFCRSCGLINVQEHFRHQICRSTVCATTRGKRITKGKVDSLSSLRDPYQCSTTIKPTDQIPSTVVPEDITWDDDMQSWTYNINDGVLLCHVFTGNQRHLQRDATNLLERIQDEVLLRKENAVSPYFVHATRLEHPSDGSGATVPGGTPHSVRVAYYTLCDFVHRYAEMDMPRFGTVRMQAWVSPGSKRGSVFCASESPVVIHCLGAEVTLRLTPKGGYKESMLTQVDKGKGKQRAEDAARPESPPLEALAEFFSLVEHEGGGPSFISVHETIESPIVSEHVDEAMATMDTALQNQSCSSGAGEVAIPNFSAPRTGSGTEEAHHEGAKPEAGHGRKKNKATKDKNKNSVPEISMTLVHGDCVVLYGDDFECQIVRVGTSILVMGFPEET